MHQVRLIGQRLLFGAFLACIGVGWFLQYDALRTKGKRSSAPWFFAAGGCAVAAVAWTVAFPPTKFRQTPDADE